MTAEASKRSAAPAGGCKPARAWGIGRADLAARVLRLVNAHRSERKLGRLRSAPALARSAAWKARHMARFRYMAHFDPAPPLARTLETRLAACGFGGIGASENLAFGFETPEETVAAWLRSPAHRVVLERPHWTLTGIGVAVSSDGLYFWAQNFGRQ